jgi:hypothetical protein
MATIKIVARRNTDWNIHIEERGTLLLKKPYKEQ